jgi:predicted ATPase
MITKFTVKSFKSLESIEVDLGQVNVFIGANGSGKSNLLEALGVLGAAASGRVDDESLLRRGVRPGLPQLYKSAFRHKYAERTNHIRFGAKNSMARFEVSLWNPIRDPKPAWRYKTETLERNGVKLVGRSPALIKKLNPEQGEAALRSVEWKLDDPAVSLLSQLRNFSIYCANTPTLRGLTPEPQVREPVGLSGGRLPDAIREIRKARLEDDWFKETFHEVLSLIDWAKDFDSAASASVPLSPSAAASQRVVRFFDRYMAKGRNALTGYDASEGALYILFAAVLALHPKSPECFAIDNLDQALNPRLATRLTECLCHWILDSKAERQVLITAHNPSVLDGLPLTDDRVRLFTVDRNNRGHTVVNRVEVNEKLRKMGEKGWTLSRLWVMGHIGGVPNV